MRTRACTLMAIGSALLLLPGSTELRAQESGVELWGRTCGRCHNARPVHERTDREWAIIMNHMRARANLTKSGAQAILEFLQAANGSEAAAAAPTPSAEAESVATETPGRPAEEPALTPDQLRRLVAYFHRLALMEPPLP